jgi:hypothetical protein
MPRTPLPIQLTCHSCSKRLQIGDQYAGRRVSCPGCKTILTAPGSLVAPVAASPPAPAPAPDAAKASGTVKAPATARAAVPPPPPVPTPLVTPQEESSEKPFSFGKKKTAKSEARDNESGDDDPPPRKKHEERGDDDDPLPRKKRDNKRDDEAPSRRKHDRGRSSKWEDPTPNLWNGFAAGCSLAWWGLWIEFLSVVYWFGILGYIFLGLLDDPRGMLFKINDAGGPAIFVPFFAGVLLGTALTFLGRTRMLTIPSGTGAKKVFLGAWAFTGIRVLAAITAAILIAMASTEWPDVRTVTPAEWDTKGKDAFLHFVLALFAFVISIPFWILADLTTIPAIAVVGGAIPSLRVRRRAGWVTFLLQGLLLAYVFVTSSGGIVVGIAANKIDFKPKISEESSSPSSGKNPPLTPSKAKDDVDSGVKGVKAVVMLMLTTCVAIQFFYTILFASLYSAGRRGAIEEIEQAEDNADDDG